MIEELLTTAELEWKTLDLKRGDYLIRAGEKEKYLGIVVSGALRAFTLKEEEEFTIRLAYKDSIIASLPAFFTEDASDLSIQAIRKTTIKRTSKIAFEEYCNKNIERLQVYNQLLKELTASFYEREIDLLTSSPVERISRIQHRSPKIFQEIPHRYIASYLRMSPETLSRLLKS